MGIGVDRRPRVLVFAYAAEPGRGSEPGAGWGVVRCIAHFADCVVLVGPEHIPGIRRWEAEHQPSELSFVEIPEPWWGEYARWHRAARFSLYLNWLRRAFRVGQQLHRAKPFDLIHHITFSAYWLPTPAIRFGVPCVWGPVGGAVTTPLPLWRLLGWAGIFDEILDAVAVRSMALLPATRRTWRQSSVRLLQNEATARQLPRGLAGSSVVLNHALLVEAPHIDRPTSPTGKIIAVGVLERRKGLALVIQALAHTPADVVLTVVGEGPDRQRLQRLARRLRVADRVEFLGWVSRDAVMGLVSSAAAAVFAGLREEGGLALAEAMLMGTPVIVLANGGAATIATQSIDPAQVALIEPGTIESTAREMAGAMTRFSRMPRSTAMASPLVQPRQARDTLFATYATALGVPPMGQARTRA